jgi:hypothetical protein
VAFAGCLRTNFKLDYPRGATSDGLIAGIGVDCTARETRGSRKFVVGVNGKFCAECFNADWL